MSIPSLYSSIHSSCLATPIRHVYVTHTSYIRKHRSGYAVDKYLILLIRHTYRDLYDSQPCRMHGMPLIFCYVCVAFHRLSFRIYCISATYVLRTFYMYIRLLWILCFVFCGVPRVCLYICNCVIKNSFVFVFHSRGSDDSNGPGCRVGLFQGYVHGSLCICWRRLMNTMGEVLEMFSPSQSIVLF